MPVPISVPVPVPVPKPAANVSIQLRYAALLPVPLLQAAAAMSDTTTDMSSTGVQQVPNMDAVPVPRLPVGRLLRGETRPQLRCHVIANCCCMQAGGRGLCMHVPVHKTSVKAPLKKKKRSVKASREIDMG